MDLQEWWTNVLSSSQQGVKDISTGLAQNSYKKSASQGSEVAGASMVAALSQTTKYQTSLTMGGLEAMSEDQLNLKNLGQAILLSLRLREEGGNFKTHGLEGFPDSPIHPPDVPKPFLDLWYISEGLFDQLDTKTLEFENVTWERALPLMKSAAVMMVSGESLEHVHEYFFSEFRRARQESIEEVKVLKRNASCGLSIFCLLLLVLVVQRLIWR